jgi:AmmeMemoRadiSam system protein B
MDGANSVVDIQAAYMRQFGDMLFRENIETVVQQLDSHLFLENENSRNRMEQLIAEFRNQPSRPAFHAGISYEADPEKLQAQLKSFFVPENGGPGDPRPADAVREIAGLVAPHIDLRSGGPSFAHGYKALLEAVSVETCVILATGHEPLAQHFALSRKDFETPFGLVSADQDFIDDFSSRCSLDLFADEFAHRREHTVEFQTLFLKLLLPEVRIVPLLCSFGVEQIEQRSEAIPAVVQSLIETIESCKKTVCLIASVDLAHIGPRYGDPFKPHPGTIRDNKDADHELLKTIAVADAEAFADILVRERNRRRICGLPPLYVMLKTLEGSVAGELLHYDHTEVDGEGSFVTYASMALYKLTPESA